MDASNTISLPLLTLLNEAELRCVIEDFNSERANLERGEHPPR